MRRADAPVAGWYPDPRDRSRLRWWDGLDWTDVRRAPPSAAERQLAEEVTAASPATTSVPAAGAAAARAANRQDTQAIIAEVRNAARSEMDRATEVLTQRAQRATRQIEPLISQYANRVTKLVKRLAVLAVILVIAWFVFQAIAQVTFFEWLGDRIDNITNSHPGFGAGDRIRRGA
ncbi:MAG: DUF2510 domain-containing protein [Desertimonas sp.]